MSASLLSRLKRNDAGLTCVSLSLQTIEDQSYGSFPSWRKSILDSQLAQWIEALKQNTCVQDIQFHFNSTSTTLWDAEGVTSLLQAMAHVTALKRLVFRHRLNGNPQALQCQASMASTIETTKNLKHLEIYFYDGVVNGADDGFQKLIRALESHQTMESLKIMWSPQRGSQQDDIAIVSLLNSRSIKKLSLGIDAGTFVSFIRALDTNTTLETLEVALSDNIDDKSLEAILMALAESLQRNQTIRYLSLVSRRFPWGDNTPVHTRINAETNKALEHMMENKFCLLGFNMFGQHYTAIDFYTKLNRAGRQRLLGEDVTPTAQDWVEILSSETVQDLSCLYYLLHSNPSLCSE